MSTTIVTDDRKTIASPGLLPTTIDQIAHDTPDRPWASIPKRSAAEDGYSDVSFRTLANAINQMAWFLEQEFGPSTNFETIAYIGKPDMRHHFLTMAAAKTGYKVLFSSHMNSLAAHLHLLRSCSTRYFLSAEGVEVSDILSAEPMKHGIVPSLDSLLQSVPVREYPFKKSFNEALQDPYMVLHTSGTTGLPKPVVITHGYGAAFGQHTTLTKGNSAGQRYLRHEVLKGRFLVGFAPFHVISTLSVFAKSVYSDMTFVFGLKDELMDFEAEMKAIDLAELDGLYASPTFLQQAVKSETNLSKLQKLKYICYAGGPLSASVAQKLLHNCPGILLASSWGSTEVGPSLQYLLDRDDWDYVALDSENMGIDWRPVEGNDGDSKSSDLYELVFVNDPKTFKYQPIFNLYPHLSEWATGDLWTKHPSNADAWRYYGRSDDLIVFSHGLKLHPKQVEDDLDSNKLIQSTLLFGSGHVQPVLLVELTDEAADLCETGGGSEAAAVREHIWTAVQQVNKTTQTIAQIASTHIILAGKGKKRFRRTAKGTVARQPTFQEFKTEIEQVYETFGDDQVNLMSRVVVAN